MGVAHILRQKGNLQLWLSLLSGFAAHYCLSGLRSELRKSLGDQLGAGRTALSLELLLRLLRRSGVLRDSVRGLGYESQKQNHRYRYCGAGGARHCHDHRYSLPG